MSQFFLKVLRTKQLINIQNAPRREKSAPTNLHIQALILICCNVQFYAILVHETVLKSEFFSMANLPRPGVL